VVPAASPGRSRDEQPPSTKATRIATIIAGRIRWLEPTPGKATEHDSTLLAILIMADTTRLGNADWLVLAGYFALLIGSGIWFSRRKVADTRDYFLANRSMPAWAVAISILATAQSAATFVGVPRSSYAGNLRRSLGEHLGASSRPSCSRRSSSPPTTA
jgi:hypothetical protein